MTLLLFCLLAGIALIGILLCLPFHLEGCGRVGVRPRFQGRVRWAGGLISISLAAGEEGTQSLALGGLTVWRSRGKGAEGSAAKGSVSKGSASKGKRSRTRKKQKPKKRVDWREVSRLLLDRQLLSAAVAFLGRLVRALHLKIRVAGSYGTDDPALTGVLAALVAILAGFGLGLDLMPRFDDEGVDISGTLRSSLVPLQLLGLGLAFLWQPPVRRLLVSRLKAKFKFKEAVQHV